MTDSSYPTLLNKRARIFANLKRAELLMMGFSYLILSALKVSGIKILLISVGVLVITKLVTARTPRGYFTNLKSKKNLDWSYKIKDCYEE